MAVTTLDAVSQDIRDLFLKGMGAMERGNYDYAIAAFTSCLDKEPTLVDVRKFLYMVEIRKYKAGKTGKLTDLLTTVAGFPFVLRAFIDIERGAPMKALRTLEMILRDAPLNLTFISMYCRAAEAAGMPELAVQTLTAAKEFFPTNVTLLTRLGHLCLEVKKPAEARECFEMVVRLRPADGAALRELKNSMALQSLTKDGWEDAAADASGYQTVRKDTREAAIIEKESKAVRSISDTEALIEDAKAKIHRDPGNVNYRRALANLYVTQKMFDEAVDTLKQAQDIRGSADPEIDAGISATMLKKFDHQIAELSAAGGRQAADSLRDQRNQFYFDDVQQRVSKYPNDLALRYELGVVLYDRDMFNEAIQQFQLSHRNPRWHIKSLYYLGLSFKAKRQFDLALDQFEKAASELISMDSAKKDVYYEMGLIKEAMDDHPGALVFFKEIYQVDIAYKDVAKRVELGYGR
ncbi:MAG: hypothetical protein WCL44_00560 [bacterium]